MKNETFVVEEGDLPTVFSLSPNSPAAPYIVKHQPRTLREMYELGFISSSVRIEHLQEAQEMVKQVSLPDAVFMDEHGQWIGDRAIPGINPLRRKAAIVQEVIEQATAHLERNGYDSALARLTAQKAAHILAPGDGKIPVWSVVALQDLEVRGILYVDRAIAALSARRVYFHLRGWIVPQGNYFMLRCDRIEGEPRPPEVLTKIWYEIAGIGPDPGPIEGWTDRLSVSEIRQRAAQVTQGWR